jgi:hypothetical protein
VALAIANRVQDRDVLISLDMVDTAPSEKVNIDGIIYQKSQRHTKEMDNYMEDFEVIMASLNKYLGVRYRTRTQAEFLNDPAVVVALRKILDQRHELERPLAPESRCLGIRLTCPVDECGLADKHGLRNRYEGTMIKFYCPRHGEYSVDTSDIEEVPRLEFNTPLRNILPSLIFANDEISDWVRVTGTDYAGYYQEQLLWRHIPDSPAIIIYAPLVLDWSGVKISKSLYVCEGGYDYLRLQGLEYCLSFKRFQEEQKDLHVLFNEVNSWVDNPSKSFRSYSHEYIHGIFELAGRCDKAAVAQGE